MEIKKVGVIGCGQMGGGIATVCAMSGYNVVVSEINQALLDKGMAGVKSFLSKSVERGRMSQTDVDAILGRLKGTTDMNDFADRDLMIEAAIENMDLKKKIFIQLDKICPPGAILATNTSCLSVIDVAMATGRPENVLGLHFFNPAPVMKLLEIVKTIRTSPEILEMAKEFGKSVGKTTIVAPDAPGFIVNRQLMPLMYTAIHMLETGHASKEDIETGVKLGLGHSMGPLTTADLVGLDTCLFIADAIYEETKDPALAPPLLLRKMVKAGWLGMKSGKGFFEYPKRP
jgi:3-hydroxybutyryl-CoA dehydrogenase